MQRVLRGLNTIQQAGEEIRQAGYTSVLLVSGTHFDPALVEISLKGLVLRHYIKKGPNVMEEEISDVMQLFDEDRNTAILAIGGGSVIDLAKSLIYINLPTTSAPLFIAAPTTCGSGSEATQFAVIYRHNKKHSLVHPDLLPGVVILDPSLTTSLSPYQAAVSGMDAFSQAVESYWNLQANDESREFVIAALRLWKIYFIPAVLEGGIQEREAMLEAAYLAGKAINITRTTGPHALSYYLTARFQVPHGHAVALFLSVFFLYNDLPPQLGELLGVKNSEAARQLLLDMMKKTGMATTLGDLGIEKNKEIENILDEVNEERMANNPATYDRQRLKELILQNL
jgi:alcohol dehydrogenase class IV